METVDFLLILSIISLILSFHEELGLREKLDALFKRPKTKTENQFVKAVQNLETMDKTKYNCVIQHNGEWVYGWIESTGISHCEGMHTKAFGYDSHSEGYNSHSLGKI